MAPEQEVNELWIRVFLAAITGNSINPPTGALRVIADASALADLSIVHFVKKKII